MLATRGEGWGLPVVEALAAGLPTIATNCSGVRAAHPHRQRERETRVSLSVRNPRPRSPSLSPPHPAQVLAYLDESNGYPLALDAVDEHGYAVPSVRHLVELLRRVADPANADDAAARGARGARDMATRFSRARVAAPVRARLGELAARLGDEGEEGEEDDERAQSAP